MSRLSSIRRKMAVWSIDSVRLHLGCGKRYLRGYLNVDLPSSQHTEFMKKLKVDIYADVLHFNCVASSIQEIRLHHLFEHFDRPTALALLIKWHEWLKPGGYLLIETPDVKAIAERIVRGPFDEGMVAVRHLFGSHEAGWAVHKDGWSQERFSFVLERLGYRNLEFKHYSGVRLDNITVMARKDEAYSVKDLIDAARSILRMSLVDSSEERLLEVWMQSVVQIVITPSGCA